MAVFADWISAYNTTRPHTALAGRTPLEVWRSDPTPVRALEHEEARWMLLARQTHVVQGDGIHHNRDIYFADELSGMRGEEVEVAYMPHDRRWIEVFHEGKWLATARPSVEFDAQTRARVLQHRREDEKELKAWARRARRRVEGAGRADHRPGQDRGARPTRTARGHRATDRPRDAPAARLGGPAQPAARRARRRRVRTAGAAMTPTHHLGLVGARVVQTAELLLSRRAIRDLLSARALGVMHGPAGSGKTFAAELAVAEFRVERAWVQFPSRPTMLHVARRLYRELTGADPGRANRFELSEELIALLAGREWLLVVDEAQWLNRECIEYLRHLHDHPRTKFSLLLVGGDGCWRVLSREPMLRSRIYRRVRFARMRLTDGAGGDSGLPPDLPGRFARAVGDGR